MSATIIPFAPGEHLFEPKEKRDCPPAISKPEVIEPSRICESETRLWKVSNARISPGQAVIELFVLVLLFLVAVAPIAGCLAELSVLMQSDAVGHVAAKALASVKSRALCTGGEPIPTVKPISQPLTVQWRLFTSRMNDPADRPARSNASRP